MASPYSCCAGGCTCPLPPASSSSAAASSRGAVGPSLVIDTHTHILPETIPDYKARYGYGGFVQMHKTASTGCVARARMTKDDGTFFRDVEDSTWCLTRREADCRSVGVDVHVLSTVPVMFSYWAQAPHAAEIATELNDHMLSCVAQAPHRLVGLGQLPMQDPELAVAEIKRGMRAGLAGFQIGTHINAWNLNDPALFPVFKTAAEEGAALFIHPWDMLGASSMSKYFLPWLVGMPAETSLAICSMLFGGVFERLPDLRVCFAHGGGSFPGTVGRVQHGFDVRPDLCAVDCTTSPRDQLGRFWVDSLVHDPDALDLCVRVFGEDKVCLGTDYPFPLGEYTPESRGTVYDAGGLVRSMSAWTDERKAAVLGRNALGWLGMGPERFLIK